MKTNFKTVIIDDNEVCTQNLCKSLSAYTEFIIIGRAKDAITGFQLFHIEQIGCFYYSKQQKQWNLLSTNLTNLPLRHTSRASDILQYSNSFKQINQHQIINIEYLYAIRDNTCRMLPPFDTLTDFHISRIFMKELQESFNKI